MATLIKRKPILQNLIPLSYPFAKLENILGYSESFGDLVALCTFAVYI